MKQGILGKSKVTQEIKNHTKYIKAKNLGNQKLNCTQQENNKRIKSDKNFRVILLGHHNKRLLKKNGPALLGYCVSYVVKSIFFKLT